MLRYKLSCLFARDTGCSYWYLSLTVIRQWTAIHACKYTWQTKQTYFRERCYTRCISKCQYC